MKNKINEVNSEKGSTKFSNLILALLILVVSISFAFIVSSPNNEADAAKAKKKTSIPTVSYQAPQNNLKLYNVTQVVDGDTIKINMDGKTETIRLIGINTPETVDPRKPVECFGREASDKAKELLSGKKVSIEKDSTQDERDKYGRLLAYITREDGLNFNKYMIEEGYAYEYTYNLPYKYQKEYKEAEQSAKKLQKGLWAPGVCDPSNPFLIASTSPITTPSQPAGHSYYTSSYFTSKYYYCNTDDGWKSLSSKYLKQYDTESELLAKYPRKVLHAPCN